MFCRTELEKETLRGEMREAAPAYVRVHARS